MLSITVPAVEIFDDAKQEFVTVKKAQTLQLEHSLISISKWESKWHKAFLSNSPKTDEEIFDYIRCMTLGNSIDPEIYNRLSRKNIQEINAYIEDPMSATTITEDTTARKSREVVTSELIYYWMNVLNIPSAYDKWHLNRLLTLIKIHNIKNAPPKKMSRQAAIRHNSAVNAANRKRFNSKG